MRSPADGPYGGIVPAAVRPRRLPRQRHDCRTRRDSGDLHHILISLRARSSARETTPERRSRRGSVPVESRLNGSRCPADVRIRPRLLASPSEGLGDEIKRGLLAKGCRRERASVVRVAKVNTGESCRLPAIVIRNLAPPKCSDPISTRIKPVLTCPEKNNRKAEPWGGEPSVRSSPSLARRHRGLKRTNRSLPRRM